MASLMESTAGSKSQSPSWPLSCQISSFESGGKHLEVRCAVSARLFEIRDVPGYCHMKLWRNTLLKLILRASSMFWGSFWPGLEGMTEVAEPDEGLFRMYIPDIAAFTEAGYKPGETVICTGKIKHKGSTYTDQFNFVKNLVSPDQVKNIKLTLAAPNWYHLRYKQGKAYPSAVYANDDEYFADIAKAYQDELKILYDHGLRNVQFDDPNLACKPNPSCLSPALP
jgi:hypothetical protein